MTPPTSCRSSGSDYAGQADADRRDHRQDGCGSVPGRELQYINLSMSFLHIAEGRERFRAELE